MKLLVVVLFCALAQAKPFNSNDEEELKCLYNSCKPTPSEYLNVHVVPHSHDDVGWLKTVDQYYYGKNDKRYQKAGVQYIIESVIAALKKNPERRFIQVETAFFYKWWMEQTPEEQEEVRKLVNSGQLEFTGGAWSMNDEAAAHYHSLIEQFTFGLMWLNETFGECGRPKMGWQIDPFGHSKEMASIFAHLGFDGFFFSRLDWRDKGERLSTKTAEMIWESSNSLGNASNIFTSVLYNHYSAPPGFCFDIICDDDPIITDRKSAEYNYKQKVAEFASFLSRQADKYATNNIIITMGDDFNYQDAHVNFKNMDALIKGFQVFEQFHKDKKMNVFYSTPSCYVKAVHEESAKRELAFPVKTDDFFPYASDHHSYWSGYFTSRPTSKRFERQANNLLQIFKQLLSQAPEMSETEREHLFNLNSAVGIMQHHDAITGTEKQHVADDYHRIIDDSIRESTTNIGQHLSALLRKDATYELELENCLLSNMSICSQTMGDDFLVVVYNPLSREVDYNVRLPVNTLDFNIKGPKNDETIYYQILPSISNFAMLPEDVAKYDLVFKAKAPAMGASVYYVEKTIPKEYSYQLMEDETPNKFSIGSNNTVAVTIDATSGLVNSVTVKNVTYNVHQELVYYIGAKGSNIISEKRSSGAYIFRPSVNANYTQKIANGTVSTRTYHGAICDEIHQSFSSWATQIIRIYNNSSYVEFDWLIGPIPIDDNEGREIVSLFQTDVASDDIFYTDSNGREMVERRRDFRETYNYSNEEPIAGNYYPITAKISIKDAHTNFSLLNDRAQGGSSLKSGEIEIMLHRRLLNDDAFGVAEALNERQYGTGLVARGTHYLIINNLEAEKLVAEEKLNSPWVFLTDQTKGDSLANKINYNFTLLNSTMPENVRILTLEPNPYANNEIILRLEHFYEINEHPVLSKNVTVDLSAMFKHFNIVSLQETNLGANQLLQDTKRFDWILGAPLSENYQSSKINVHTKDDNALNVTLNAMQIRTFIATIKWI